MDTEVRDWIMSEWRKDLDIIVNGHGVTPPIRTPNAHLPRRKVAKPPFIPKLNQNDVSVIKSLLRGGNTQSQIAKDFGVSQSMISSIKRGESWRGA